MTEQRSNMLNANCCTSPLIIVRISTIILPGPGKIKCGALGQEYSISGCLRPIKENVYLKIKNVLIYIYVVNPDPFCTIARINDLHMH